MFQFEDKIYKSKNVGHICELNEHVYFFGNKHCTKENIVEIFPEFQFCFLKQIHGNHVFVRNSKNLDEIPSADAHITNSPNIALCILTADCIPALGFNGEITFALHAGWRGIISGIFNNTLTNIDPNHERSVDVCVGPHIKMESYEVTKELIDRFQKVWLEDYKRSTFKWVLPSPKNPEKRFLLNLEGLLSDQVSKWDTANWWSSPINTMTSDHHNSYRRNATDGRNISFVARRG